MTKGPYRTPDPVRIGSDIGENLRRLRDLRVREIEERFLDDPPTRGERRVYEALLASARGENLARFVGATNVEEILDEGVWSGYPVNKNQSQSDGSDGLCDCMDCQINGEPTH